MGLYTPKNSTVSESYFSENTIYNKNALVEMFLVQELMETLTSEEILEFTESEECREMLEKGDISSGSVMFLSKLDDLSRRTNVAAIQMAKSANDAAYKDFEKAMALRDKALGRIYKKYKMQATKDAKLAQREFIKKMPNKFRRRISIN